MPAETPEPLRDPGVARRGPRWAQPDLAWPLAVLAGFLGTWAALLVVRPWLAVPLALALLWPLEERVRASGNALLATWLGLAFLIGIAGAVAGTAIEAGSVGVVAGVPLADVLRSSDFPFLDGRPAGSGWATLPRNLVALGGLLAAGRYGPPLLAVGLAGLVTAALSACAAVPAAAEAGDPLRAFLATWPPHLALGLLGGLFAAGLLGTVRSDPATGPRRDLLAGALGLAALGLLPQGLWFQGWVAWAS